MYLKVYSLLVLYRVGNRMRDSKVKSYFCNSVDLSGTIQVGDSVGVYPFSIARAVQKENPVFIREYVTDDETVMQEPLPNFLKPTNTTVSRVDRQPIRVKSININGVTGSSVNHIGSFKHGKAISILRHRRILINNK